MGQILDARSLSGARLTADVCVIGTGAGGAVAAKELAERGLRVIALEEGGHHTREEFNRRPADMLPLLYRDAGLTGSIGRPAIAIPLGRAVGGTTLINSGTCFRTPDAILEKWSAEFGLPDLRPSDMVSRFERVERILNVTPVAPEILGRNGTLMKRATEMLGLRGRPIPRNAKDCRGSGVCCFGCPTGAKQSTDRSYVPLALEHGADVYVHARANEILVENRRAVGVRFEQGEVRAKAVVLSAGAILTPAFLQRQKLALSSGQVGRNLTVHPTARMLGVFSEIVDGWNGVPQGFYVDDLSEEGIILEGIHGPPPLIATGVPFLGQRMLDFLAQSRYLGAFGILIEDESTGRVNYSRLFRTPIVTYSLGALEIERLRKGIALAGKAFLAAGAEKLHFPVHGWDELTSRSDVERFLSAPLTATDFEVAAFHPLGTCRMGVDPKSSVVDPWGETHEVPGLWILDGSILPSAVAVNPQVSIMAVVTRGAEELAKRLGEK